MTSERIVPLSEYHRLPQAALSADFYKRQLEVVCNNATLALFIMDECQRCVYMNPAAEALTGYSLTETQGRALHDVIHHTRPDGSPYPLCECPIDQVFPQNNREQGEEVFVHKDGHFYPVAYTASPIREGETTIGTIIEVRDITQEKLDQQTRQDASIALASINDGFYTLDRNWCFTYVNDRYCQMVRMQPSDLLGQNIWKLFPDAVNTEAYVQFHQAMTDQTPRQFDYLYAPWNCWHDHRIYPSPTGLTILLADITARKQAEADRQQAAQERERLLQQEQILRQQAESAERRLYELLESIRDDFVLFDHNWRVVYLNSQATLSMQKSRDEILGRCFWDLFPDLVGTEFYDRLHQAMHDQTSLQFEYHYQIWDTWFENRVYPADEGIIVLCSNITDRKRAELNDQFLNQLDIRLRQLPTAEAMAEEAVNSVGEFLNVDHCLWGAVDLDRENVIVEQDWRQPGISSLVGTYRISDFVLPSLIDLYHAGQPAVAPDITTYPYTAPFSEHLRSLNIYAFLSIPCIYEGRWVAMLFVNSTTVRQWRSDEVTLLQEVVARLWSLIEYTRAVQELRQSEAQFRQLADAMPQQVWITDAQGNTSYVNQQWIDYTGLTIEQTQDIEATTQIIHPDDFEATSERWQTALTTGMPYQAEFRLKHQASDAYRWFLSRAIAIRNEQGQIVQWFGTSTDIEEFRRAQAEREQLLAREQLAREQAETANRIKDEFLAVLSHELRSPLNPILGWSKLLQQGKLDATKTKIALDTIDRNAQLQVQLIDDLLDISRILRGKLSLNVLPVDLSAVISAALETVHLAAEAKGIDLRFEVSERVDEYPSTHLPIIQVLGDAGRLQQVIWNLLSNAVKFTPHGGRVEVKLATDETDEMDKAGNPSVSSASKSVAQITVSDTGKGIKPDFLPYVFEHFRQEDGATTRKFGGLGLGLAIARQIVEMHGGQIRVDSLGEEQGATFTVKLPLQGSRELGVGSWENFDPPLPTPHFPLTGLQILVVDDEADSRELVAFVLEQAGAVVTRVSSGIEALQIIKQSAPDLIVSDIGMPEMDGYMLMQQVRRLEQGRTVPAGASLLPKAIALTAYAGEFDRQQALQAGFQRHLSKPIEPEGLIQAIVALIHGAGGSHGNT